MALSVICYGDVKFQTEGYSGKGHFYSIPLSQSSSCPHRSNLVAEGPLPTYSELSDSSSSHEWPLPRRMCLPHPRSP